MLSDVQRCSAMFDVQRCSAMFDDVRRCSAMFGDVRRYYPIFRDIIRYSAILSELQFTIVTLALFYDSTSKVNERQMKNRRKMPTLLAMGC